MRKTPLAIWFFFPLLLFALAASAQTLPLDLQMEIGFRWTTNLTGNQDLYRTQINERHGFVLRNLNLSTGEIGGTTDFFRLDASDLGTSPAGALRIDTGRSGLYRVRFGYRTFDSFRVLPAFANPLLGQGIIPGQHSFDRNRTMFDADVELLAFRRFTPFAGYSWGRNEGPGTTTYTLGGDEFLLASDVMERDREFRVGTAFNTGRIYGSITQGWRTLSTEEDLTLLAGSGNSSGSILGTPVHAATLTRSSRTDVDAPFTNLYVVAEVIPKTKLIASYHRLAADANGAEIESATGSFVSFGLSRFFTGVTESVGSNARNDTSRAGLRAEYAVSDGVTLLGAYQAEKREIGGTALIDTLFRDTVTFGGVTTGTLQELLDTESALNRDETTVSAGVSARLNGPLSFRAEVRRSDIDYAVHPDIAEIVIPGNQGSEHSRSINTIELAGTWSKSLFTVGATYRFDEASREILRTDFGDRARLRVRGQLRSPGSRLRLGLTAERGRQENIRPDTGFATGSRLYTADLEAEPASYIRFRGSYSRIAADSRVSIRRPETFAVETSQHNEKGEAIEGGVALLLSPVTVDASVSRFSNEGTLPFDFERYRVRVTYDFFARAGIAAEWSTDDYRETAVFGRYNAERVGVFLRLRP